MSNRYKLYGADFSLYTCKARCYLYKKCIPFDEILSTVRIYKNFIMPRTGVRYIPVVQTPDDIVYQDTTTIIDELEKRFPAPSVYPSQAKQKLVSLLLETYGDEWLVIPAMHYRWAYQDDNQPFIFQKFGRLVSPRSPKFIQAWLGKKLGSRFKRSVTKLGIKPRNVPAIEASYRQLLEDLNHHFQRYDYLLGGRPCIADFSFVGPLCAHLYHDPHPGKYMREHAPAVVKWIKRMTNELPAEGDFLPNDDIPDTLLPILKRMTVEQLPVLLDTDKKLSEWRLINCEVEIPRTIGEHEFSIQSVTEMRAIIPYSLWMFKRPVNHYHNLSLEEKAQVAGLLSDIGFGVTLERGLENKLVRLDNILQFEQD